MTIEELGKLLWKCHQAARGMGYGNLTIWQLSQILTTGTDTELALQADPADLDILITNELKNMPYLYEGAR